MKGMNRKSARALLLILSTFTYLLLGATVFGFFEGEEDNRVREEIDHITGRLRNKYNFTRRDMQLFEAISIKSVPQKAGLQWKFAGAFYFATLVITTVGYGHSAPETTNGKMFCMIFALAGIPMGLIMFQSIGERVNTFIAFSLHKLRDYLNQHGSNCLQEITPTHLLFVSLSIGTIIIVLGAHMFHSMEKWSLFDSYYLCFITFSTIGFGDLVPLQQPNSLQNRPIYVIATLLFILIGLAVFSACVNLLVLGFMAPNADEVTAAQRDLPGAIVLERFARNSLIDSQLFGVRKPSSMNPPERRQKRLLSLIPNENFNPEKGRLKKWKPQSLMCCICKKERPRRYRYSLTRQPTANIEHLVNIEI